MRIASFCLLLFLAVGLGGCATVFNASAPADQNSEYVVGASAGERAIWRCPVGGTGGDCERMEVQD